jgi:hypothetical protein
MIVVGCNSLLRNVIDEVSEDRISDQCVGLVVQLLNSCQGEIATGTSITQSQEGKPDQSIWDISLECAECSSSTKVSEFRFLC